MSNLNRQQIQVIYLFSIFNTPVTMQLMRFYVKAASPKFSEDSLEAHYALKPEMTIII